MRAAIVPSANSPWVVREVATGVTTRKIGDRVGVAWVQSSCGRCEWCLRGKPMFCAEALGTSMQLPGGHAEYMLAFADATTPLPEGLSFEQAAPIFCAGYTVWSGLRWAAPQPGERVAVVGIGGLGHLAQVGRRLEREHVIHRRGHRSCRRGNLHRQQARRHLTGTRWGFRTPNESVCHVLSA